MWESISTYFDSTTLIPHGYCLQWNPALLWTLVISDSVIALSYFSIPFAIWYFAKKRPDIPNRWLFLLFGAFIIACGITHLFDVLNIWQRTYWGDAASRVITATLSLTTAIVLWRVMPAALRAPSSSQLIELNHQLEKSRNELEHRVLARTEELAQALSQARRFSKALDHISACIYMKDTHSHYVYANQPTLQMFNCTSEALVGRDDFSFFSPETAGRLRAIDTKVLKFGEDTAEEVEVTSADGVKRYYWEIKTPIYDENEPDKIWGLCGISTDISERKQVEESLKLASLVFHASTESIMVVDADSKIITVNPAFTDITGYLPEEVIGKNPRFLSSGRHDKAFFEVMWASIRATGKWTGELWNRRKNGDIFLEWLTIDTIYNNDGSVRARAALFSDFTEKKKFEELIWQQANFDTLTALPNRRMIYDHLDHEIKKSHRGGKKLAVLYIDLDRFKEVNDTLGHEMGDLLLKEAACRIESSVRDADVVGRLGGDEFLVILAELDEVSSVGRVANNILNKLEEKFDLGKEIGYVSSSIGITIYPDDGVTVSNLLRNADQAMYAAKRDGRGRFNYYTASMQEASALRLQMINDLHAALRENQFEVYYQPIVELSTGSIHKAEALVRWNHPVNGLVSPVHFIPLAEETGLIVPLGNWVFIQATNQVAKWRKQYHPEFQVSINKSPVQFRDDKNNHLSWVMSHLHELGLTGQSIVIEITEGVLMEEREEICQQLLSFRDHGIQVALDDFGTGYSSLSYLQKFDIDYIKIDQSFVSNLVPNSSNLALCEAIIIMAHKLKIKVIAEGVETEDQRALLMAAGCDYAQGYLFSRPVKVEAFESLLAGNVK